MLFSTSTKSNPIVVTQQLLHQLGVNFSKGGLRKAIEDHPDYPSLLSISDSLNEWHIPTQAYRIAKEDYTPSEFQFPFMANLADNGGKFVLVHAIVDKQIFYSDERSKKGIMSETDFLRKWTGAILYANITDKSGEPDHWSGRIKDIFQLIKIPLLLLTLAVIGWFNLHYEAINAGYAGWLLLKLTGVMVAILLLIHSIDANNPLIQNLCSLANKDGCNAILKTDAAKVTSWLSWSEVGFFYFAGSFLSLLFLPASLPLLTWLNVLSLPYTVYSITYQYRQRNWCLLCCTVQGLLWLEFLTNISLNTAPYHLSFSLFSLKEMGGILLCFLLPVLVWATLKDFLLKSVQVTPMKEQLNKFKYNSELFSRMLKSQPRYAVPDTLMPVLLGNPAAEIIITMVSNAFCGPCAKAHQAIDEWLDYRDDLQLKIIFITRHKHDDEKIKVSRHVSALTTLNDPQLLKDALNDWYARTPKKYESWAEKFPVNVSEVKDEVTEIRRAWCDMADITYTPTILVNGYKLPEPYRLEDIKYLLS